MDRITNFLDIKRNIRDDFSYIIDDEPVQLDIYRIPTTGTKVGFSSEIGNYTYLRKIVGRLAHLDYNKIDGEVKGNLYDYTFITFDTDVQMNDRFKYNETTYTVKAINEEEQGYIEIKLSKLRNEA